MNLQPLLTLIGKHESKNDFNAVWGGIKAVDRPKVPLVKMTIREVLAWQDSIDARYRSEAAGCWQFMEDTLRGLWYEAGCKLDDKFDEKTQTKLATALLYRRGLHAYLQGKTPAATFANNLAKEWASLPVATGRKAGKSYYDGDGLNKSGVSVQVVMDAILDIKSTPTTPITHTKENPVEKIITVELSRIIRHSITPVITLAVAAGWLPEAISGPLIETILIATSFVGSLIWSRVARR